jgi:hypothetical protein
MNKQHQILLLRASYWLGAIIDLLAALQLFFPSIWASMDDLPYSPNPTLNFALYIAGSLMIGWTFLLVWADRKPLERKGILLLTVFPVVFGLALNNVFALNSGLRTWQSTFPELGLQISIALILTFSYFNARKEPS